MIDLAKALRKERDLATAGWRALQYIAMALDPLLVPSIIEGASPEDRMLQGEALAERVRDLRVGLDHAQIDRKKDADYIGRLRSPWRSVADDPPPVGVPVLARKGQFHPAVLTWTEKGWRVPSLEFIALPPEISTHWMPIPPLPEDK